MIFTPDTTKELVPRKYLRTFRLLKLFKAYAGMRLKGGVGVAPPNLKNLPFHWAKLAVQFIFAKQSLLLQKKGEVAIANSPKIDLIFVRETTATP